MQIQKHKFFIERWYLPNSMKMFSVQQYGYSSCWCAKHARHPKRNGLVPRSPRCKKKVGNQHVTITCYKSISSGSYHVISRLFIPVRTIQRCSGTRPYNNLPHHAGTKAYHSVPDGAASAFARPTKCDCLR